MARVVFLDRDGTINVDRGYISRLEDWEFAPNAVEALRLFSSAGFAIAVVTNQSGIARGMFTQRDLQILHDHMAHTLANAGVRMDAIAFCPHGPDDGCECRKPRIGMRDQIARQLGTEIDMGASWTIGDKLSDFEFGSLLGTRCALIRSRYWQQEGLRHVPHIVGDSLYDIAREILGGSVRVDVNPSA